MTINTDQFIAKIAPEAQKIQEAYGVPASLAIAQAALESEWGKHARGNNYFGVKAGANWHGASNNSKTREVEHGVGYFTNALFRKYESLTESVMNYGKVLAGSRYVGVVHAANAFEAADAVQQAGYATDPEYADKLKSIISQYDLTRFDDPKFQDYTRTSFEKNRRHLKDQRVANPKAWDSFIRGINEFLESLLSSITSLFSTDEHKVVDHNTIEMPKIAKRVTKDKSMI